MSETQNNGETYKRLHARRVALQRRRDRIIPLTLFATIMLATGILCATVTMRTRSQMQAAAAKYQQAREDVERLSTRGAGASVSYNLPPAETDARHSYTEQDASDLASQSAQTISIPYIWVQRGGVFLLFLGFLLAICSARRRYRTIQPVQQTLRLPRQRVPQAPLIYRRLPSPPRNYVVRRESDIQTLRRQIVLLVCSLVLASGFIISVGQRFAAVRYGDQTEALLLERSRITGEPYQRRPATERTTPPYALIASIAAIIVAGAAITAVVHLTHSRSGLIKRAPGTSYLAIVEFFYSPRTVEETFKPIVADWRTEYFESLAKKRKWKARWVSVRYVYSFAMAMGLSKAFSFLKAFLPAGK